VRTVETKAAEGGKENDKEKAQRCWTERTWKGGEGQAKKGGNRRGKRFREGKRKGRGLWGEFRQGAVTREKVFIQEQTKSEKGVHPGTGKTNITDQ